MQVYNAIVLRNLPRYINEDEYYSFHTGDKVILTIEDNGVMWIDEIGHNPATSMEVDEDDVAYFKNDNLFELLERRVNYDIQHDLDYVDMYLGDLALVIKVQQSRVKLTRDKLNQITDDKITALKSRLDAAFNLTWGCQTDVNAVIFGALIKDVKLDVYYYFKANRTWSNSYAISGYFDLDEGDDREVLLINKEQLQSIDEVINYISTFFLRLKDSVNYLEVNNAAIHTISN